MQTFEATIVVLFLQKCNGSQYQFQNKLLFVTWENHFKKEGENKNIGVCIFSERY